LEIQRGNDPLLINPNALLGPLDPSRTSSFSNVVVVDSHGDTDANGDLVQTYPFNMGGWDGTPGVTVNAVESADDHVSLSGDYHAAYSPSTHEGSGGPTSELTRQVVYLRPDYVVVHDRVTTRKADYVKQLRWHFLNAPTVHGNAFVETSGNSKLFGQT